MVRAFRLPYGSACAEQAAQFGASSFAKKLTFALEAAAMDLLSGTAARWGERYRTTQGWSAAADVRSRRAQAAAAFVQQQRAMVMAVHAYAQKRARKMRSKASTDGRSGADL